MQVKDIMVEPPTIDKSEKISYALDMMDKLKTRRLLVMHNDEVQGIVTMRSITRELGSRKKSSLPASAMHVVTATTENYNKVFPDMSIPDGVILMNKNEGILIVVEDDSVAGWVTPQQVIENYPFNNSLTEEIMCQPVTIGPEERVIHARRVMLDNNVGRLPVLENGTMVGIVTEHDIAKALRAFRDLVSGGKQDSRIKNLLVEDIMSRGITSARTDTPVHDVVAIMLEKNLGGLPVTDDRDELVGIVSRRSLLEIISRKM